MRHYFNFRKGILFLTSTFLTFTGFAQLTIQTGAIFLVQSESIITFQGDLSSNANIQGTGLLEFKGTVTQNLNMHGHVIQSNIEIDNTKDITLNGDATASGMLSFKNGRIILGENNLTLTDDASWTGAGSRNFFETNGAGKLTKQVNENGTYTLPLGNGTDYMPIEYTLTGASLSNASISGRLINNSHPNKHPRTTDFLNQYWNLTTEGITGGTITATGVYPETNGWTGTEIFLKAMCFDGENWSDSGSSQNNSLKTVTAKLASTGGDLFAMNRFVLASPKVFLQGAYVSGGLMNDLLRNNSVYSPGTIPSSNLIPNSDPYRTAPYSANFTHVLNSDIENIQNTVLADQPTAANNIVDWVFVELRSVVSPTVATVSQTRSALLRRDGTIVDVDGQSPVYFKNAEAAAYVISVRHRNHLGISMDPGSPINLGLNTPLPFDFSTAADVALFGSQGNAYITQAGLNLMWAGNVNANSNSRYQGTQNDRSVILTELNNNELLSTTGYLKADINMNRSLRYQGAQNDRAYLLSTVLANNELNIRNQALPN